MLDAPLPFEAALPRDRDALRALTDSIGLTLLRAGSRDLALWDGVSFRLAKPAQARSG